MRTLFSIKQENISYLKNAAASYPLRSMSMAKVLHLKIATCRFNEPIGYLLAETIKAGTEDIFFVNYKFIIAQIFIGPSFGCRPGHLFKCVNVFPRRCLCPLRFLFAISRQKPLPFLSCRPSHLSNVYLGQSSSFALSSCFPRSRQEVFLIF